MAQVTAAVRPPVEEVCVRFINHQDQRYDTIGDWWLQDKVQEFTYPPRPYRVLHIRVSDLGDDRMNMAVALHEQTEAMLCDAHGIDEKVVSDYDLAHLDSSDPGSNTDAPYNAEHTTGEIVERLFIRDSGLKWREYEDVIDRLPPWGNPLRRRTYE